MNRELSWLEFNDRVLQEANNPAHPLLERLRFLAISDRNLDEFYMVRVASLQGQLEARIDVLSQEGLTVRQQLGEINKAAKSLVERQQATWKILSRELEQQNISIVHANKLKAPEKKWLKHHFMEQIFPTRVFIQDGSPDEREIVTEAVCLWNGVYPIKLISNPQDADIYISWNPATQAAQTITHPSAYVTDSGKGQAIRTVMMINMASYATQEKDAQIRGMLHQLGHASGLWGHSDDPHDVMYPAFRTETADFPEKWNRAVVHFSSAIPEPSEEALPAQPSPRDIKTMMELYSAPAQDISTYAP